MKTYEERCDMARRLAQCGPHDWAAKILVACKIALSLDEAERMLADGDRRAASGLVPLRPVRYDPVMQATEDQLAKRHGRRAAQEMVDEEEVYPLHRRNL